jgi:GT2 family glycosyltransferase
MTGSAPAADFTVVVCTRNRPLQLARAVDALRAQSRSDFAVTVVDQGDEPLQEPASEKAPPVKVIHDSGTGLSRAGNIGWRDATTEWVVFLDDDCVPEPDWAERLGEALTAHPEASLVSGNVLEHDPPPGDDYLRVSVFEVSAEELRGGRWTRPWHIGLGACMAVRRSELERLGGFDERFGPGIPEFPGAGDMDFNYRYLRSGGVAFVTPRPRVLHEQWRMPAELGPLYRGYMSAWSGFAMKHLRGGDFLGGLWLWSLGVRDAARMLSSAARRRSTLRLRVFGWKVRGLASGTVKGLARSW